MNTLFSLWISIQQKLFPWLNEVLDPLTEKEQEFVRVAELAVIGKRKNVVGDYAPALTFRSPLMALSMDSPVGAMILFLPTPCSSRRKRWSPPWT